MAAYRFLCCVLCISFLFCSGCTSLAVGNVTMVRDNLTVDITNSGSVVDAGIQVRVYQIVGMEQKELTVEGVPATLSPGNNRVEVPLHLDPGNYKVYVYITIDNQRQTASIKDLVI